MSYVYEVGPINYFNLSEPERNAVLSGFASALQQLSAAAVFHVKLDSMSVVVGNELYSVAYRRYFLESDQPLEGFLAAMGLQEKYVRLMEVPAYSVAGNLPHYVVLENGDLAKAYTITGVSSELDVAFLARDMGEGSIIDKTDEVRLRIEPLKRDESKGVMRLHADTLQAKVALVETGGGRDRELSQEAVMAEEAAQSVISGAQRLFRVSCVLILREKSLDALRKKAGSFYDMTMGVVTELDSPKGIQHIMVTGEGPKNLVGANILMPTDSVLAFFPFAGLDVIEHNGVFLGTNIQTKGPIVYDVYSKSNPHLLVLGKTGTGKCLSENSMVVLSNGEYLPIRDMGTHHRDVEVLSLDDRLKIRPQNVIQLTKRDLLPNETMLRLTTRTGRILDLTSNHPLLTFEGWRRAGDLQVGNRIAAPRTIPIFGEGEMPECLVKILAYFISEGGLTQHGPSFTNGDDAIVEDMRQAVATLSDGLQLTPVSKNHPEKMGYRIVKKGKKNGKVKNPVVEWLDSLGLLGRTSHDKFIPQIVFTLKKPLLALFLNRLFSGDGGIWKGQGKRRHANTTMDYGSMSEAMIHQVQHLLLRFGIISRIRDRTLKGLGYELIIEGRENITRFIGEIGFIGEKSKVPLAFPPTQYSSVDSIPKQVWRVLGETSYSIGKKRGLSKDQISALYARRKHNLSRAILSREAGGNPVAEMYANSDVIWDQIKKVEVIAYDGPVYDLSLAAIHNFIAQDVFVHNSMLLKSWVSRMALTYPDLAFMAFDSVNQSEYGRGADRSYERSFAGVTGAKVVRFNPSQPMGLDPLRFFGKRQAASLLAKMAGIGIDERSQRAELNEIVQSSDVSTTQDVFGAKMTEELRKRVNGNLKPLSFMFDGEPQQPYMRTIFVLDDLPNDEELRGSAVVLASALAMAALKSLPIPQKKVLLIDEAWAFLATDDRGRLYFSEAMDIVSEMARTGRHYNVALVLATQYGKDLMNGQGKTVLESCATKVLLHQDAAGQGGGSDLAQQIFGLSDQERAFIERADRGFGILLTEQGRVPFYNKLTEMEYSYFTTKPDEVGRSVTQ